MEQFGTALHERFGELSQTFVYTCRYDVASRRALRHPSLLKSPGFLIAAVVSLALGIGANAAIFTMINTVFLQPLPVEKPAELMYVYGTDSTNN